MLSPSQEKGSDGRHFADESQEALLSPSHSIEPRHVDENEAQRQTRSRRRLMVSLVFSFLALSVLSFGIENLATTSSPTSIAGLSEAARFKAFAGLDPRFVDSMNSSHFKAPWDAEDREKADFRGIHRAQQHVLQEPAEFHGWDCITHFSSEACPLSGACLPPDPEQHSSQIKSPQRPCLNWKHGRILHLAEHPVALNANPFKLTDEWDVNGQFDDTQAWLPAGALAGSYRHLNSRDALHCLAGKRLFIQGDSMMRQLFGRLVGLVRGQPQRIAQSQAGRSLYTVSVPRRLFDVEA